MFFNFVFFFLLLFTTTSTLINGHDTGRIVNGTASTEGTWPFVVSLIFERSQPFCGGAIISDDTILTATHCAFPYEGNKIYPANLSVYVGHINIKNLNTKYLYQAKEIIINKAFLIPKKNESDLSEAQAFRFRDGGDVCLIKLVKNITFESGKIDKICLPSPEAKIIGNRCTVMGWGKTNPDKKEGTKELREAVVPIIDPKVCSKKNHNYNEKMLYCAGNMEKRIDACMGDSGGPLVCPHEDDEKEYLLFGIVSFGESCGNGGFYQKTTPFIDWIKKHAYG